MVTITAWSNDVVVATGAMRAGLQVSVWLRWFSYFSIIVIYFTILTFVCYDAPTFLPVAGQN